MLSLKSSDFWVGKTSAVYNGNSYCLPPPWALWTDLPIPLPSAASELWHRVSWQCHFRYSSPVSPLLSALWTQKGCCTCASQLRIPLCSDSSHFPHRVSFSPLPPSFLSRFILPASPAPHAFLPASYLLAILALLPLLLCFLARLSLRVGFGSCSPGLGMEGKVEA